MESLEHNTPQPAEQFNTGHKEYASFIEADPIRNYLHYPRVMEELGQINNQNILDIGCGDGLFDRKLAEQGAKVVGYDISPNLIEDARKKELENNQNIEYSVSDPLQFESTQKFDNAVTIMVLPYAPDEGYIKNFFASAYKYLKNGGKFISVVFNPEFKNFNIPVANRFFRKNPENKVGFDFLRPDNAEVMFSGELAQFTTKEYETAAAKAGFKKLSWEKLLPTEEGVKSLGTNFWEKVSGEQPYSLLIAEKLI